MKLYIDKVKVHIYRETNDYQMFLKMPDTSLGVKIILFYNNKYHFFHSQNINPSNIIKVVNIFSSMNEAILHLKSNDPGLAWLAKFKLQCIREQDVVMTVQKELITKELKPYLTGERDD